MKRGYNPLESKLLKDEYFVDAPRSGRPKKINEESTQAVLEIVRASRTGRSSILQVFSATS